MLETTFKIFALEMFLLLCFAVVSAFTAGYIAATHAPESKVYSLLVGVLTGLIGFLLLVVVDIYIVGPVIAHIYG